jgi:hypothetical protein
MKGDTGQAGGHLIADPSRPDLLQVMTYASEPDPARRLHLFIKPACPELSLVVTDEVLTRSPGPRSRRHTNTSSPTLVTVDNTAPILSTPSVNGISS